MARKYRKRVVKTTVKEMVEPKKFVVVRDTQEKKDYWTFIRSKYCDGTVPRHMETGDYTLEGMEHIFSIDRKASTGELSGNICTKRFVNELKRGNQLKHFFIICAFSLKDIMNFPYNSTIPNRYWRNLRVTPAFFLKKIIELECNYNVKFIFCDNNEHAKEVARAIFKQMILMYGKEINA